MRLDKENLYLKTPGSQVDVRITSVRAARPIIVPARSVVARPEGTAVSVVHPGLTGMRAHWTQITILRELGKDVEVLADGSVSVGATLVISPPANLGDNEAIEIAVDSPAAVGSSGK